MNANFLTKRLVPLAVAAFVLIQGQAFAQSVITQTDTFDLTDPGTSPSNPLPIDFNQFNPALGTLTSVTLELNNVVMTGKASVTNITGSTSSNYAISLAGDYTLTDTSGNKIEILLTTPTQNSGPLANNGTFTTTTESNNPAVSGTPLVFTTGLSLYIGTGNTTSFLTMGSKNGVTVTGTAPYETNEMSTGVGTYELIYTYTPVPEPTQTAGWMIGFALCLLIGRKYFQRRQASVA